MLYPDDAGRARRDRRSRHHTDGGSRLEWASGEGTGGYVIRHRKVHRSVAGGARHVLGEHGVAVHGAVVPRGLGHAGKDLIGDRPTERVGQAYGLDVEWATCLQDIGQRGFVRQPVGRLAHGRSTSATPVA